MENYKIKKDYNDEALAHTNKNVKASKERLETGSKIKKFSYFAGINDTYDKPDSIFSRQIMSHRPTKKDTLVQMRKNKAISFSSLLE